MSCRISWDWTCNDQNVFVTPKQPRMTRSKRISEGSQVDRGWSGGGSRLPTPCFGFVLQDRGWRLSILYIIFNQIVYIIYDATVYFRLNIIYYAISDIWCYIICICMILYHIHDITYVTLNDSIFLYNMYRLCGIIWYLSFYWMTFCDIMWHCLTSHDIFWYCISL